MKIINKKTDELIAYARNPRKNDQAVDAVAASLKEFGFKQPIVIDQENVIVAGHTRLKAAQKLGLKTVPCVVADDLTPEQVKAYRLLDNRVAEKAEWDVELLSFELGELDIDWGVFDVSFDDLMLDNENTVSELLSDAESYESQFLIVVTCRDEAQQQQVFEQLSAEGLLCKLIM